MTEIPSFREMMAHPGSSFQKRNGSKTSFSWDDDSELPETKEDKEYNEGVKMEAEYERTHPSKGKKTKPKLYYDEYSKPEAKIKRAKEKSAETEEVDEAPTKEEPLTEEEKWQDWQSNRRLPPYLWNGSETDKQFELYLNMYPKKRKEILDDAEYMSGHNLRAVRGMGPLNRGYKNDDYKQAYKRAKDAWIKENYKAMSPGGTYPYIFVGRS